MSDCSDNMTGAEWRAAPVERYGPVLHRVAEAIRDAYYAGADEIEQAAAVLDLLTAEGRLTDPPVDRQGGEPS